MFVEAFPNTVGETHDLSIKHLKAQTHDPFITSLKCNTKKKTSMVTEFNFHYHA